MQIKRTVLLSAPALLALALLPGTASAHGTMNNPPSRTMVCYTEGPENPKSAACKQAVALGGTQPLYDWNEVNIADAAGRSRQIIPDGKLCSAGRAKYRGFDQARADWPATTMTSGANQTFRFRATAPHKGTFELYLTKDGYDPAKPLKWSDLDAKPFLTKTDPALSDGSYVLEGTLPARKGRHLIYVVWQRSDSPEAFYSCSDVVFGGTNPTPAPTPTGTPTATPKPTPTVTTTATPGPGPVGAVDAGVGVAPRGVRLGQAVKVTAVCGDAGVGSISSRAFTPRTLRPATRTTSLTQSLKTARKGSYPVTVICGNGGMARTVLTVS